jgi:hypothetical protein
LVVGGLNHEEHEGREGYEVTVNPEGTNLYSSPLVGQQLLSAEKRDDSWSFGFSGEVSLATETSWRLIDEDRLVVTSEDHGHQFGLPEPVDAARVLSSIVGRAVEGAEIDASSGDLTIEFSGRVRLELLQMSGGYESWRLSFRGSETICTGGGKLVHLPGP